MTNIVYQNRRWIFPPFWFGYQVVFGDAFTFSERTVEKLVAHEEMQKFIKWVAKKEPNFYQRNKQWKQK